MNGGSRPNIWHSWRRYYFLISGADKVLDARLTGVALGERLHVVQVAPRAWWSLAYMVIFSSIVTFSSYVWLLKVISAARVAMYCYVNPVVAVLLGWQLADERVTFPMIRGAAIILIGVLLVDTAKHEPAGLQRPILAEEPGMPAD